MDEFAFIEELLTPLAFGRPEALNLRDDAAIIPQKPGYDTIITKDAIASGTHFFADDAPYNIARKLLRVNLSDLAAKGAEPYCCFLGLILPEGSTQQWLKEFTCGLRDDLEKFGCFLAGGDTAVHQAGLVLTLTVLGHAPHNAVILRSGAKAGDLLFVTGTIGDSYLGLKIRQGQYRSLALPAKEFATERYLIPQPRLEIGQALRGIATSCCDISDGLPADLRNISVASGVGAIVQLAAIPFSPAARQAAEINKEFFIKAIAGGDDYELLFTAPAAMQEKIIAIARQTGIAISNIGTITAGAEIKLLDSAGKEIMPDKMGYRHNAGQ